MEKTYTQSELDKRIAKAREDEQIHTLVLLKKLGVINEDAMTKLAKEGYWDEAGNLRIATDVDILRNGEK